MTMQETITKIRQLSGLKDKINPVYGIPEAMIPELKFIQMSDFGEIPNSGLLSQVPAIHKFSNAKRSKLQIEIINKCSIIPQTTEITTKLLDRFYEIENSLDEILVGDKIQGFHVEKITDDGIEETTREEPESLLDVDIEDRLESLAPDSSKVEARKALQELNIQCDLARKEAENYVTPKFSGINKMHDRQLKKQNVHFIESAIVLRANIIYRHILALSRYANYDESMFGIENTELRVSIGNAKKILKELTDEKDPNKKLFHLYDLLNAAEIVVPPKKELIQREVWEPSIPNAVMRVDQEKLMT